MTYKIMKHAQYGIVTGAGLVSDGLRQHVIPIFGKKDDVVWDTVMVFESDKSAVDFYTEVMLPYLGDDSTDEVSTIDLPEKPKTFRPHQGETGAGYAEAKEILMHLDQSNHDMLKCFMDNFTPPTYKAQ